MNKNYNRFINYLVLFLLTTFFNFGFSQLQETCGFDQIYKEKLKDPEFKKMMDHHNSLIFNYLRGGFSLSTTVVKIPVVVHVLHLGETIGVGSNISDAQIQSSIDNLNDVYRNRVNGGISVDLGVEFELAKRDPNCNSTNGIVRVNASSVPNYSQYGVKRNTIGASDSVLKDLSKWPTDQYMNFWIVTEIDDNNGGAGTQGYANLPVAIDEYNGAVMMYKAFGYDPTGVLGYNLSSFGRTNGTVTHEVGHFLDLYHPFQGETGSCPPTENNCSTDGDFVCDTPPIRNYLNYNNNTVYFNCPTGTANDCSTGNLDQVMHNIMNYTSCPDRFTAGQKARIQAALATSRLSLTTSLGLTAPSGSFSVPKSACASITAGVGLTGGYGGITETVFGPFLKSSLPTYYENPTNGYMDFSTSCLSVANVIAGQVYPLKVTTWFNTHNVKAWIDYNNNGVFTDSGEEITTSGGLTSTNGAQVTKNITIPNSPVLNTYLRMRVIAEVGAVVSGPCYTSTYGQAEDYAVYITSSSTPVASVSIASNDFDNIICEGSSVMFTATPTNGGSSPTYQWKVGGVNAGSGGSTFTTSALTNGQVVTCVMTSNLGGVMNSPSTSNGVTMTITSIGAPTGTSNQSFCSTGTVANLVATGSSINWYSGISGGSKLQTSTVLAAGTYYASQIVSGCESVSRFPVIVSIIPSPAPTGSALQTFCTVNSKISDLVATGTSLKWYSVSTGGTSLSPSTTLSEGIYYATQTVSGCESANRFGVTVSIPQVSAPMGDTIQSFCSPAMLSDVIVSGSAVKWYSASSGGSVLTNSTILVDGNRYFGTQTVSGCESINRLGVKMNIHPLPIVTIDSIPMICYYNDSFQLTQGHPTGGIYSGNGILNGYFNPNGVSIGYSKVTYTFTDVNSCSDSVQAMIHVDNCAGLKEFESSQFKIYPNPAEKMVTISSDNGLIKSITLVDNLGRIVMYLTPKSVEVDVDLQNLMDGIYTMEVSSESKTTKHKLSINR